MGQQRVSQPLLSAAAIALFAVLAAVLSMVVLISVIFPSSGVSCQNPDSNGLAVSTVNVPAGLSAMARELWDKPLAMQPGHWYPVGATEYDGASGGHYGSIPNPAQSNLDQHPDSFAELSLDPVNPANTARGFTFHDANALGELPYMTGLRVARNGKSIVVYKRDIGYGQGPSEHTQQGFEYRVDLWGPAARALGVSKDQVDIQLAPKTGTGEVLEATPATSEPGTPEGTPSGEAGCLGEPDASGPLPLTSGESAQVLQSGLAAAPKNAPAAVKAMIAAGNRLYGTSYVRGGAHGTPLSTLQPGYDCSSAVSYVLYAGGVFGEYAEDSTGLESYGAAGPGQWVTVYANSQHAFMYVAGLRFDTSFNGTDTGPNAGKGGPRWRVLNHVPTWAPWVLRHPPGL